MIHPLIKQDSYRLWIKCALSGKTRNAKKWFKEPNAITHSGVFHCWTALTGGRRDRSVSVNMRRDAPERLWDWCACYVCNGSRLAGGGFFGVVGTGLLKEERFSVSLQCGGKLRLHHANTRLLDFIDCKPQPHFLSCNEHSICYSILKKRLATCFRKRFNDLT